MNNRFSIIAFSILVVSAILGGTVGDRTHRLPVGTARTPVGLVEEDYEEAVSAVAANYAGEIDYQKATQAAIQGMLTTLDPHSLFFPSAEFQKLNEDQGSRFYGIGVSILQHRDGVYVQGAVPGTPAARAGLRYGDRIVEINGQDVRELSSAEVSKRVRGERGESVVVKVERAGVRSPLSFTLVRDSVSYPSITTHFIVKAGVGYVGLTRGFQKTSGEELHDAITDLRKQGMRQMILDLRSNPGGLLSQAIDVASEFIPKGKVIVSVRGREYPEPVVYHSNGNDNEDFPLVVLINRGSASASEIVSGAIQDHGRGLIVGETSFGKALVQRVYPLLGGNGLTLTTGRYYTPYGRSLQRDYSNGSFYDYYTRHNPEDQNKNATTKPPATDTSDSVQKQQTGPAVKTEAGRVFYGGGGIVPDIEAKPLESSVLRNRINEATFFFVRQLAAGRIEGLENYDLEKTEHGPASKPADFPVTDHVVAAFASFARADLSLGLQSQQLADEADYVKLRLRVEIIIAAFNTEAGARAVLENDPQVLKAIESLPDAKRLADMIRNGGTVG